MKQIELKIAWSFRISTEFETFRNIFETCTMTRTVTPWPACRCILSHLFQAGRKYSRDGKSCQRIQTGHFDSFWTSDDIGQATLADTEMEVSSTSNSLPGENWIKKKLPERSMPPVCHRHTITPSQAQNTEHFNNLGASIGHSNTSTTTGSDKTKIAAH